MTHRRLYALALLPITLFAFLLVNASSNADTPTTASAATTSPSRPSADGTAAAAVADGDLVAFLDAQAAAAAEWYAGVAAANARPSTTRATVTPTWNGVGDCTGFPIPDYVITRESRGNPGAVNATSGAYGCTQIMPGWWGGACSDLDQTTVEGQRACTQIILDTQGPGAWSETW